MKKLLQIIKTNKENIIYILLILIISLINLRGFFKPGIFQGHDLECHLARIANNYLAIKDGHFPVRWAKNLNHKFGYPVFNYNYPLANMAAYPLIVLGFSIENSLKIILFSSYFLGGLFFYLWMAKHFSKLPALVGAVFFLCAPYQFLDLYIRGSIGETISFLFFPLICYLLVILSKDINKQRFLALAGSIFLFSLSHNIMVLIFTPIILVYLFILIMSTKNKLFIKTALKAVIFGFLLGSFFWIPAYFERKFVNLDAYNIKTFYQDHFIAFKQLVYSPWQYGFSVAGPNDTMSFQIGIVHLLVLIISLFTLLIKNFYKEKKFMFFWLIIFVGAVLLMLSWSNFLWQIIPFLGYIQFPWRFLSLTMIGSSVLAVFVSQKLKILGLILAIFCIIYCQQFTKPFSWKNESDMYYFDYLFTTSIRHENTPKWFEEGKNLELKRKFISDSGLVTFNELEWKTGKHIYEVEVPQTTTIWEHTAYFPGWQGYIDGKQSNILYNNKDYPGIIGLHVPSGKHQIVTKFTENTIPRILGDSLSLISFIFILMHLRFINEKK